jgi:hypothetical protein
MRVEVSKCAQNVLGAFTVGIQIVKFVKFLPFNIKLRAKKKAEMTWILLNYLHVADTDNLGH